MITYGTVQDWLKVNPKVSLKNKKIVLDINSFIHCIEYFEEPFECTYPSCRPDGPPMLYIGGGFCAPYMQKGKFHYRVGVGNYYFGHGSSNVLSDKQANDPWWFEYKDHAITEP